MSFVFLNVNSNVFAEVSTNNHLRLCNSIINITFMHVFGNLPIAAMMLSTCKLKQNLTGDVFQIVERTVLGCYQDGSGMVEKIGNCNSQIVLLQRWVGLGLFIVNKLKPSHNHLKNRFC